MSRFAVAPQWLIYLPPTMSPCETSTRPGLLEHPAEAFAFYRRRACRRWCARRSTWVRGPSSVVCKDADAARERFGVTGGRVGHHLHPDGSAILQRRRAGGGAAGAAARGDDGGGPLGGVRHVLGVPRRGADAVVGEGAGAVAVAVRRGRRGGAGLVVGGGAALERATARMPSAAATGRSRRCAARADSLTRYTEAYRAYCWPVAGLDDLKLAPFHLLATEGAAHVDKGHVWHMETLAKVVRGGRGAVARDPIQGRGPGRPAGRGGRRRLVGGDDAVGRRGHGREAGATSSRAASAGRSSRPSSVAGRNTSG